MMVKRKLLVGTVDEYSADQEIHLFNCEKSGGLYLAELGLMAGWQSSR